MEHRLLLESFMRGPSVLRVTGHYYVPEQRFHSVEAIRVDRDGSESWLLRIYRDEDVRAAMPILRAMMRTQDGLTGDHHICRADVGGELWLEKLEAVVPGDCRSWTRAKVAV